MKLFKRFKLKKGKEELNSTGGNYVCGQMIPEEALKQIPEHFQQRRKDAISDRTILMTMVGMLCNGRTDFDDVKLYQNDAVLAQAFRIDQLPSEDSLRQRLDELPQERSHAALRGFNQILLQQRSFGTVQAGHLKLVPLDIDVSPLDNSGSNKQGVCFTYKRHDGFAPVFAYIGTQGYMLDNQLRPGSQHCQSQTPEFIARCMDTADTLGLSGQTLLRLDSGNDAAENCAHFGQSYFIVKRNLRKESREQFHSELKSDLDVERLPSGKFAVNAIVLLCANLAFNLLRSLGQEVIARSELATVKIKVQRWRLKTVLENIIYCAVRVVRHAREIQLQFGKYCAWFDVIEDIARAKT